MSQNGAKMGQKVPDYSVFQLFHRSVNMSFFRGFRSLINYL
jgi:hypothetical protein